MTTHANPLRTLATLVPLAVAGGATANQCDLMPNGSFVAGTSGWTIVPVEDATGGGAASAIFGVVDGTVFGGEGYFDEHVLVLQIYAAVDNIPGAAEASLTATTTVTATGTKLRFRRGGGFEFLFWGGAGYALDATVTVTGPGGAEASVTLTSLESIAEDGCDFGLSILGTFYGDPPDLEIDLAAAGITSGDVVDVTISLSGGASTVKPCQSSETVAGLILDRFTFCNAPGDVDGDGAVGLSDLLAVLSAWGPCPAAGDCDADLDCDLTVGLGDLLLVLSEWG